MNKQMIIEPLARNGDSIGCPIHVKGSDNFREVLTDICAKKSNHAWIIFMSDGKETRFRKREDGAIMSSKTGKHVSIHEVLALIA